MYLSFTQLKQIRANCIDSEEWRETIDYLTDIPEWMEYAEELYNGINSTVSFCEVMAIRQGGCASAPFMPAVTFSVAVKVMSRYGDDILTYIEDILGDVPDIPQELTWGGIASFFLSSAVELWAAPMNLDGVDWD